MYMSSIYMYMSSIYKVQSLYIRNTFNAYTMYIQ